MKNNEKLLVEIDNKINILWQRRETIVAAIASADHPNQEKRAAELEARWKGKAFKSDSNTFIRLRNCRPSTKFISTMIVDVDCINLHSGDISIGWSRPISFKPNDEHMLSEYLPPETVEISEAEFIEAANTAMQLIKESIND